MPHLLKRLELNGFKSFAGKTILEFPAGITAIVGPNGSGKSNVVDSIRWLLGERDAKSLRGGKIEDLIFAGTPHRPRVGQAQATLYFENHHGFFPVDFEEVSISRMVNRSGESKYFLNGSEILLRDLVDFLAKVRLGSRGIVVVTQGNSDLFLQASPDGRREMLEEVLGLREYQLKKSEAERKLKSAVQNLSKVKALVEEILPHLRSLRRQTNRWEKRSEYEEELKTLENQYFGRLWQALEAELREADKKTNEHSEREKEHVERLHETETNLKSVEAAQPAGQKDLLEIRARAERISLERSRVQRDIGRLEAQAELLEKHSVPVGAPSHADLMKVLRKVREELSRVLHGEPESLREIVKQLLAEIEVLTGDKDKKEPETKKNADPVLTASLKKLSEDLKILDEEMTKLRSEEDKLSAGQHDFHARYKSAVDMRQEAREHYEKWNDIKRQLQFSKEKIALRREELERRIAETGRAPEEFSRVEIIMPEGGFSETDTERRVLRLRGELAAMGEIDQAVVTEAKTTEERYEYLEKESADLTKAEQDLRHLIKDLSEKISTEFESSLGHINREFNKFFGVMFDGGHAELVLSEPKVKPATEDKDLSLDTTEEAGRDVSSLPEEETESDVSQGIEVSIKLPKKRVGSLDALSGGERSLVGIAAIFAIISVSPPPFLVLDEIDAPLDERNARKFAQLLREFVKQTQFILVTHNRATMEAADILYGVTLDTDGSSKILSMKLEPSA